MKNKVSGIRVALGYTQQEMANKFGISRQAYWNKENGKTAFTDREKEVFTKLAKRVFPRILIEVIFFGNEVWRIK